MAAFSLPLAPALPPLLSLARSRGVERYSFRGGGRLDEAVVVAEEEEEDAV